MHDNITAPPAPSSDIYDLAAAVVAATEPEERSEALDRLGEEYARRWVGRPTDVELVALLRDVWAMMIKARWNSVPTDEVDAMLDRLRLTADALEAAP